MSASDNGGKDNSGDLLSFETWRRKVAFITGLGLSPEEARKRREMRDLQLQSADWEKCEKWKTQLWQNSAFLEQFSSQRI
jgi:inner membrane protease ATP23